ncbi:MAG: hypothetical protein H3C38_07665 [Rhodospirillales bacterium]|nr:hypothetical protein [Rhodospirillales bacterium]
MTVSFADWRTPLRTLLAAVLASAAVVAGNAAHAQPAPRGPQVLTPQSAPRLADGAKDTPSSTAPTQPAAPTPQRPPALGPQVEVDTLQAIDPNSVGILGPAKGGFGIAMWQGTSLGIVQRLLPGLPTASTSRTMRDLMRRLLLSEAAAPRGERWGGKPLLALRVDAMMASGDLENTRALVEAIPQPAMKPPMARRLIDALLLAGETKEACRQRDKLVDDGEDAYLAKVRTFCQIVNGRTADAQLSVALLREFDHADAAFYALAEAMLGLPAAGVASLPAPSPLLLAMFKEAGKPLPHDAAATGQPAILRAIARSENAETETRLAAAEKAERIGALATAALADLYLAVQPTPEERARPAAHLAAEATPRSRALLYQAVTAATAPAARAEAIGSALAGARMQGAFFTAARLYAPMLAGMQPGAEMAAIAGPALRALLAVGETTAAERWLPLAAGQTDAGHAASAAILTRIAALPSAPPVAPAALVAWTGSLSQLSPPQAERQAAIVYGLLESLGDEVPAAAWVPLMEGPPLTGAVVPKPALWHALPRAAAAGRKAETVLLALASLGEAGAGGAEPTNLYRIVTALRQIGLEAEARALAIEAAVANGL